MSERQLVKRVYVAGVWYGPGDVVPDDVAARITNPAVWAKDADADDGPGDTGRARRRGPQLVKRVLVDGVWYGPNAPPPPSVWARIRNPNVWDGGQVPAFAAAQAELREPGASEEPATVVTGGDAAQRDGEAVGSAETAPPDEPTADEPATSEELAASAEPAGGQTTATSSKARNRRQ